MSSGYLNRLHFTAGGATWEDENPGDCYLNGPGLDMKWIDETWPEAEWLSWVSPQVNSMDQVVLRINWINSDDTPVPGFADVILFFATVNEEDFTGSLLIDSMLITVDMSVLTGDYYGDTIDIDVSHFFGGDITHAVIHLQRMPLSGPEVEVERLTFANARTLLPAEIAASPEILPWEPMPPL